MRLMKFSVMKKKDVVMTPLVKEQTLLMGNILILLILVSTILEKVSPILIIVKKVLVILATFLICSLVIVILDLTIFLVIKKILPMKNQNKTMKVKYLSH